MGIYEDLENETGEKERFLKLSYDIKNPLTVCYGYLEMIKNANDNEKEEYLNLIKKELDSSIKLIDKYVKEINRP